MLHVHADEPGADPTSEDDTAGPGVPVGDPRWNRIITVQRAVKALALLVIAAAVLTLLTSLSQHAIVNDSDTSTVVLEGFAMRHGNVLLHNWSLSLDSFWTVDVPFYALGTFIIGLRPLLVNVVPAFIGLGTVVAGIFAARDDLRGRAVVVGGATVTALLILPSHALSFFFLQGPWHIATGLWCLLGFIGLRNGRFGWGWCLAVLFLAAGLLGDVQALAFGVLPMFAAGLVAIARRRSWRGGVALISAAAASVVVSEAVREVSLKIGTFTFNESHHTATASRMSDSIGHLLNWSAALFGVISGPFGGPEIPLPLRLAHLIGLLVVLACVGFAAFEMVRSIVLGQTRIGDDEAHWRLDDLLLLGIVGDLGVFEVLTLSNNVLYARYLTVAVIFAIVLTGRVLGRASRRLRAGTNVRLVGVLGLVLVAAFSAEVGLELAAPIPAQPAIALDGFLSAHHLREGIGDYWAASAITVQSDGEIAIRPVVANLKHKIVPDGRQAPSTWYSGQHFQFLVYQSEPYGRVDAATVAGTFGAPKTTWIIGQYRVVVWSHPITLTGPAFP